MKTPKNIAASVRQRLLNQAREGRRPFNELLQYYAIERFLYRLCKSSHAGEFILKGALMLRVWNSPELRPTKDIDVLGKTSNDEAAVVSQIKEILAVQVEDDGLIFDSNSIRTEQIAEDADYEGIRVRFGGTLGTAKINLQIDIGFGDVIHPKPEKLDFPTILNFPAPCLLCYSRESLIAEKFEAMVKLGSLNSRMKDFYDIWLLSRLFNFDSKDLAIAIRLTFERRETSLSTAIEAFSKHFCESKQIQWTAFRKRLHQEYVPDSFEEITTTVAKFLSPVVEAIVSGRQIKSKWTAPGPWNNY